MNKQKALIAVVVLQSLVILSQWSASTVAAPRGTDPQERGVNAMGMLGSGTRDTAIIEELKALNAKVDRLTSTLESGKLTVNVVSDKK